MAAGGHVLPGRRRGDSIRWRYTTASVPLPEEATKDAGPVLPVSPSTIEVLSLRSGETHDAAPVTSGPAGGAQGPRARRALLHSQQGSGMENPYVTPRSNLALEAVKKPAKRFWKVVFWLHVALTPLVVIGVAAIPTLSVLDKIDAATLVPILLVLYGYSHDKAFFRQPAWQVAALAYPLWFITFELVLPLGFGVSNYGQPVEMGPMLMVSVVMGTLTTLAFWLYGFRSPAIWQAS